MRKILFADLMGALVAYLFMPGNTAPAVDPDRPTFENDGQTITARMDMGFCWLVTFQNETKGLAHTLRNAYKKDGSKCPER